MNSHIWSSFFFSSRRLFNEQTYLFRANPGLPAVTFLCFHFYTAATSTIHQLLDYYMLYRCEWFFVTRYLQSITSLFWWSIFRSVTNFNWYIHRHSYIVTICSACFACPICRPLAFLPSSSPSPAPVNSCYLLVVLSFC